MAELVSIGLMVHNGAKYLEDAIESILRQSYQNIEIVISDNFSIDKTQEICEKYALQDRRIRYFRQSKNIGPYLNSLFVRDKALGLYFMWAAHDDIYASNWIESHVSVLDNSDCVCFGIVKIIDNNGLETQHISNLRKFNFDGPVFWRRFHYYISAPIFGKGNPVHGMYRLDTLKRVTIQADHFYAGDMVFLFNFLKKAPIKTVNSLPIMYKRLHDANAGGYSAEDLAKQRALTPLAQLLERFTYWSKQPLMEFVEYKPYMSFIEKTIYLIVLPILCLRNYYWALFLYISSRNNQA
jgi:glycosyltransferase involved in cell wall biosynthesis